MNRSALKSMGKPDCQKCGACCVTLYPDQSVFCNVTKSDLNIISPKVIKQYVSYFSIYHKLLNSISKDAISIGAIKTRWVTNKLGPLAGIQVCSCSLLSGSLFHRVRCRIYPNRPTVCRQAYTPGSQACLTLRNLYFSSLPTHFSGS